MTDAHIARIVGAYQHRREEERFARRVGMTEIEANDFNLNISRYVSTAGAEAAIDLAATHRALVTAAEALRTATDRHNAYLKELGLSPLP